MAKFATSFLPENKTVNLYQALINVMTPRGLVASSDELYEGGIFGRDSLRVALDLLPWHPDISEMVLISLGSMMAFEADDVSEARGYGHIPHEARFRYFGSELARPKSLEILKELSGRWGGSRDKVVYYGAADTTPQYVRLCLQHVAMHGPAILEEAVHHMDGKHLKVIDILLAAIRLTAEQIKDSELGLLEFTRTNPLGHKWKVMRDGSTAYLHEDGSLANAHDSIATIELQGLAFDCLKLGADFFEEELGSEVKQWRELADRLRQQTLKLFWIDHDRYFAQAIDRHPKHHQKIRQVTTRSSAPAELLETTFFDGLEVSARKKYIAGLVTTIFSPHFLTSVGVRMRSREHSKILPYYDYHGANVVWGMVSNVIAQGLAYQGFSKLAAALQQRVSNGVAITGDAVEFWYVDDTGKVFYRAEKLKEGQSARQPILLGTNKAESQQAWTTSGELRRLLQRTDPVKLYHRPISWQQDLDNYMNDIIPPIPRLTVVQAAEIRESVPVAYIDTITATEIEQELIHQQGYLV